MQNTDLLREQVLRHFPAGAFWIPPLVLIGLSFVVCFVASKAVMHVRLMAYRSSLARDEDPHWTEKARLLWSARLGPTGMDLFVGGLMASFVSQFLRGPLLPMPHAVLAALIFLGGLCGILLPFDSVTKLCIRAANRSSSKQRYEPRGTIRSWIEDCLLHSPGLILVISAASIMPAEWGMRAFLTLGFCVVIGLALLWHAHLPVLLRFSDCIKPAPSDLLGLVQEVATELGQPLPRTYLLRSWYANAMVLGPASILAVTDPALQGLTRPQMHSLLVHEFAHLKEDKRIQLQRLLPALAFLFLPALVPFVDIYGPWKVLPFLFVPYLLSLYPSRKSSHWEEQADALALAHEREAGSYAKALESLNRIGLTPMVLKGQNLSHPNTYDRMLAAGLKPGYPRPDPPLGFFQVGPVITFCVFFVATLVLFGSPRDRRYTMDLAWTVAVDSPWRPVVMAGAPESIFDWAFDQWIEDRNDAAFDGARFATAVTSPSKFPDMHLDCAELLLDLGEDQAALQVLQATKGFNWTRPSLLIFRGLLWLRAGEGKAARIDRDAFLGAEAPGEDLLSAIQDLDPSRFPYWLQAYFIQLLDGTGERAAAEFWLAKARSQAASLGEEKELDSWLEPRSTLSDSQE